MADAGSNGNARPAYVPPKLTVMSEAEVLKSFQITSAAASWWIM
jgi:hypothetical protein